MISPRSKGRPRHGADIKDVVLPIRTTRQLRRRIEQAARESGRSLTLEIETRLNLSFDLEEDEQLRAIARAALQGASNHSEERPHGDRQKA